jgi:hypothetical protein
MGYLNYLKFHSSLRSIDAPRRLTSAQGRFLGRPLWTAGASDADRHLANQRKVLSRSYSTVHGKALALRSLFEFLVARHQGDIHALTGHVVGQVIDEFNRPASPDYGSARVPPATKMWRRLLRYGDRNCPTPASS